jgi:hypothetical protein
MIFEVLVFSLLFSFQVVFYTMFHVQFVMTIHPANIIVSMHVMGKCSFLWNRLVMLLLNIDRSRNSLKTFSPFSFFLNNHVYVCIYIRTPCSYIRSRHLSRFIRSVSYNDWLDSWNILLLFILTILIGRKRNGFKWEFEGPRYFLDVLD